MSAKSSARLFLAVLFAMSLLAAACTSDGEENGLPPPVADADGSTTEVTSPTTSSSTSVTTTTTTETDPDSDDTSVTRPLDDAGKPLIEIPEQWDSDLDEIFGRYQLYWDALDIAFGPPEANPNYAPLVELMEEDVLEEVQVQIQDYQKDQLVVVLPEDSISDHVLRLPNPSVLTKEDGNEVVLQDCTVEDLEIQTTDGEVVERVFESFLRNVTLRVIDGEWRVWAVVRADSESSGYQECIDYITELS